MIYRFNTRNLLVYVIGCLTCCLLFTSCSKPANTIGPESEYIIVHSRAREKSSGIYCINDEGIVTEKMKDSDMQDLSFFSFDSNKLLISGGRSNNNMLFNLDDNGAYSEIYWLNEPQYSGVTAVELLSDSGLAIMNGNYTDETYLNLLVEQDFEGNVIQQNVIELYSRDVAKYNNNVVISGKHLSKENDDRVWQASIINYSTTEQRILSQHNYAEYNCFWKAVAIDDILYCLAEDKSESISIICTIDLRTNEVSSELKLDDQLSGIHVAEGSVYAVGDMGIYRISSNLLSYEKILEFNNTENGYVNWTYVYDSNFYVFYRFQQRVSVDETYRYGYLYQVDLHTLQNKETPIIYEKKITLDDILIFPTQMFRGADDTD